MTPHRALTLTMIVLGAKTVSYLMQPGHSIAMPCLHAFRLGSGADGSALPNNQPQVCAISPGAGLNHNTPITDAEFNSMRTGYHPDLVTAQQTLVKGESFLTLLKVEDLWKYVSDFWSQSEKSVPGPQAQAFGPAKMLRQSKTAKVTTPTIGGVPTDIQPTSPHGRALGRKVGMSGDGHVAGPDMSASFTKLELQRQSGECPTSRNNANKPHFAESSGSSVGEGHVAGPTLLSAIQYTHVEDHPSMSVDDPRTYKDLSLIHI